MLINCDVKGLEVVVAAQLSGDVTLRQEIIDKADIHANNQKAFNLGEGKAGRLIAKIFKFRLIYGGSAYSYANDTDFMGVSTSQDFWQDVIDTYYRKYYGIKEWHDHILQESRDTGRLVIPSGRYYPFEYEPTRFGFKWPETKVKNYPVQGFGADLVKLARLECAKRLRSYDPRRVKLVSTIHDSIVADVDNDKELVYNISKILNDSVEAVPKLCREIWGYDFSLPLTAEVKAGYNKSDMEELDDLYAAA
jgi:DNA polymerase I-like protein with 3'-5' exonuclease and polymerase domains